MIRSTLLRRVGSGRAGGAATMPVDGSCVAYQTSGNAEQRLHTLVFIHGGGTDSRSWRRQLPFFGHSCYCIAPDLSGHGRSEGEGADSVSAHAGFVCRFLDALSIRQPVVMIGHELGGLIAQHIAVTEPRRLAALVLVATGAKPRVSPQVLAAMGRGESLDQLVPSLFAPGTPSELLREQVRHWNAVRPEVRLRDFVACNHFDGSGQVGGGRLPALVLGGEADPVTPATSVHRLHERMAGSEVLLIPQAGHYPMLEQPEAFNAGLDAFLDSL